MFDPIRANNDMNETQSLPESFLQGLREQEQSYLAETDPVRQSGFGGGHDRWRIERSLILDAVTHDGDFLDVGCANGYLLECLVKWAQEKGVSLTPYGVDCGQRLFELAKKRLPEYVSNFWVANAYEWAPPRRFCYVYTLYDCVPEGFFAEYMRRLLTRYVEPGGILIIGAYGSYSKNCPAWDVAGNLNALGFKAEGIASRGSLPISQIAWIRAEKEDSK